MRIKLLVAAAGFAAFATPSLTAEFYIVQDTTTKRCTIVEQTVHPSRHQKSGPRGRVAERAWHQFLKDGWPT